MDATAVEAAGRSRPRLRRPRLESALVRAAQRGSREAVVELFERHWDAAYRAAYWIVHDTAAAEDIAQEAFLAAVAGLERFDLARPFGPWLRRIVVNRAIDHARARTARREVGIEAAASCAAPEIEPADPALLDALAALPVEQRAVVVMRHVLGCTPRQIAAALDLPVGTVNSRARRGLDAMKEALDAR